MSDNFSHLKPIASRYDLNDPDDRASFRSDVADAHRTTKLSAINGWLNKTHKSRQQATRDLADQYIKANTVQSKKAGGKACW